MTPSMNRRRWLALAAAALSVRCTSSSVGKPPASRQESIAGWRRRVQSFLERRRVPIIDLQATYVYSQTNLPRILEFMEEVDVALIAFAAASPIDGSDSLELHRRYPERFIPTTNSGEIPRWWNDPLRFLEVARKDLKSGQYFFMGEHEFRHYPSPEQVEAGQWFRDITVPLDGPAGHALFQLSEDFGVAFQIHYDIEDALLPALESVLARYPKALPIWCHLAMIRYPDRARRYSPAYVRSLIERSLDCTSTSRCRRRTSFTSPRVRESPRCSSPAGASRPAGWSCWRPIQSDSCRRATIARQSSSSTRGMCSTCSASSSWTH